MFAPVENTVEVDRVQFPPSSHRRHIFVEPCDESYMSRPGFGRDSSMRYAKSAMLEDAGAQKGGEGTGDEIRLVFWVWFWKGLEGFICSKTVTCSIDNI